MRVLIPALILLTLASPVRAKDVVLASSTTLDGYRYISSVAPTVIEATPSWTSEMPNPPLSARKALQIAKAFFPKLVDTPREWEFDSLSLRRDSDDKWYYLVTFADAQHWGNLPLDRIKVVVLMNEKVVISKIGSFKKRKTEPSPRRDSERPETGPSGTRQE